MGSASPLASWRHWRGLGKAPVSNSLWVMASNASLVVLQMLQFLILARSLGPHEFGHVASIVAITSALLPFSGLGLGNIAIIRIARGQEGARTCLGNALATTLVSGTVLVCVALLVGTRILPQSGAGALLLLFGLSELLMTKCIDVCSHVFFGLERHRVAVIFYNLHMLVRLGCAATFPLHWVDATALAWAELHLASGVVVSAVVLGATVRLLGRPRLDLRGAIANATQGVLFSITISARSVQTDGDKSVLARLASASTAGVYTAAYRIAYMACLPVFAILLALQPRVFRRGRERGIAGTLAAMHTLAIGAALYCVLVAGAMFILAPLVPWLLGSVYESSTTVLRALCLLPFLLVFQAMLSAALSGADGQRQLGVLHGLTAALSLLLNIALVPQRGWAGSVIAAYGSQAFLLAGIVGAIAIELHRQRRRSLPVGPEEAGAVAD